MIGLKEPKLAHRKTLPLELATHSLFLLSKATEVGVPAIVRSPPTLLPKYSRSPVSWEATLPAGAGNRLFLLRHEHIRFGQAAFSGHLVAVIEVGGVLVAAVGAEGEL